MPAHATERTEADSPPDRTIRPNDSIEPHNSFNRKEAPRPWARARLELLDAMAAMDVPFVQREIGALAGGPRQRTRS